MSVLSPAKYKLTLLKKKLNLRKNFSQEVLDCYRQRLEGHSIRVAWQRDGKFIVGMISVDKEDEFMTQAKSAKEFVEMVNDALYATYEIPAEYIPLLGGLKRIMPPASEFKKLNDAAVKKSSILFEMQKVKT